MTDFNDFGSDQYVVDMQKTYPMFSDTQTNYLDVMTPQPVIRVTAPEQLMRMDQQRIPSYVRKYPCGDINQYSCGNDGREMMKAAPNEKCQQNIDIFDLSYEEKIILLLILIIIFICYSFNKTLQKIMKHVRAIEAKLNC